MTAAGVATGSQLLSRSVARYFARAAHHGNRFKTVGCRLANFQARVVDVDFFDVESSEIELTFNNISF